MSKFIKAAIVLIMALVISLGSLPAQALTPADYHLDFSDSRWQIKYNQFVADACNAFDNQTADTLSKFTSEMAMRTAADNLLQQYISNEAASRLAEDTVLTTAVSGLNITVQNFTGTYDSLSLVTATPTYATSSQFTIPGNYTTVFAPGNRIIADLGVDLMRGNIVASSSFASPNTTVTLTAANLTANLAAIYATLTRDGFTPYGPGYICARDFGTPSQTTLQAALDLIGVSERTLVLTPGTWSITSDMTVNAHIRLKMERGAVLAVATGKTLTINSCIEAGPYQIFSWAGTGSIVLSSNVERVRPEWFYTGSGAYTDAFNKAFASIAVGAELFLQPHSYTVGPLTCAKAIRINAGLGAGSNAYGFGAVLRPAGAQTHVLKWGGASTSDADFVHGGKISHVSIVGSIAGAEPTTYAISDAVLILQNCQYLELDPVWISSVAGRAIRFHNVMDSRFPGLHVVFAGVDGDCIFFMDAPDTYWNNNLTFDQGHFEDIKGSIVKTAVSSAVDQLHFSNCKFERNNALAGNTINVPAFSVDYTSRFSITNSVFTNFNDAYQTVMVDFVEQNSVAIISGNQFMSCNWSVKVRAGNNGPIVVKDNLDVYNGILTLDNSCAYGGAVYYEEVRHGQDVGRHELFAERRTPFIPAADLVPSGAGGGMIKDTSGLSLGKTGQLMTATVNNSYQNIANFSLRQFAGYPGDMQVWLRAKSTTGTGIIQTQLWGEANYNVDGARTYPTSLTWQCFTISRAHLAVAANWDTNDYGLLFVAGNTVSDVITFDGIYIVLLPTSSTSVAYAATVTPDFGLYNNLTIAPLTGAVTIANPSRNITVGHRVSITLASDSGGPRAITWGTAYWSLKTSLSASKAAVIEFLYDGSHYYQVGTVAELP